MSELKLRPLGEDGRETHPSRTRGGAGRKSRFLALLGMTIFWGLFFLVCFFDFLVWETQDAGIKPALHPRRPRAKAALGAEARD